MTRQRKGDPLTREDWIKLSVAPIVVILAGIILNWSITGRIDDQARRLDAAVDKIDAVAVRLDARIDGIYEGLDRTRQEVTATRTDVSSRIDRLIDVQVDVAKRLADQGAQMNALTVAIRERRDLGSLESLKPFYSKALAQLVDAPADVERMAVVPADNE